MENLKKNTNFFCPTDTNLQSYHRIERKISYQRDNLKICRNFFLELALFGPISTALIGIILSQSPLKLNRE